MEPPAPAGGAPLTFLRSSNETQIRDVAQRRCAEQAAVLAAELGRALITDPERGGRRILILGKQQPPRFVQAQPFLVLQRAHGRHLPEMMVEGRCAHIDLAGEIFYSQWLCEVAL